MNSREELMKKARAESTHEERQTAALEGIHDMLANIQATLSGMQGPMKSGLAIVNDISNAVDKLAAKR